MSMTVADLRAYVRDALDSDSTEFTDTVCDVWMNEAINRILRAFEPWNYLEKTYDITSDGSSSVSYTSIGTDLESISSMKASNWQMRYLPHELAVKKYAWAGTPTGRPIEWSTYNSTLYFWPTPNSGDTFEILGFRSVTPAIAPTDTPDMPSELHPLIGEYMLARALEKQGDFFISPTKFQRFEEELNIEVRRYQRGSEAGVQSIGEGPGPYLWGSRLRYDFEARGT